MSKLSNLTGMKFTRWTVLERDLSIKAPVMWKCKCDCGVVKSVRAHDLVSGKSKSCKCLALEYRTTHGLSKTKMYTTWANMIQRCEEKEKEKEIYKNYSGRGIKVCDEWKRFDKFYEDMSGTYKEGLTLDRIDNEKGYSKNNCRWATMKVQLNNRRNNAKVEHEGIITTLTELSEKTGVDKELIRSRLRNGKSLSEALEKPSAKKPNNQLIYELYNKKMSLRKISIQTGYSWTYIKKTITEYLAI